MIKKDIINKDRTLEETFKDKFYCPKCKRRFNDLNIVHSVGGDYCIKCGSRVIRDKVKVDNNNQDNNL
jgi:rRNA maturation endonuclease Nob1